MTAATITAGAVTLSATATTAPDTSGTPSPIANIESTTTAIVELQSGSSIISSGAVSLTAASSNTANAVTTGLSVGGADAAIAVTVVNSTATTGVLGGSSIQANGGDLTLAAVNTTNVVTSGDASKAADGGAVAVSVVTTSTQAFISDAGMTSATGNISITADTKATDGTTAKASPGGASSNKCMQSSGCPNSSGDDSPDTLTGGNDKVQDQNGETPKSIPVAAAIAFTDFSDDTEAFISGTTVSATGGTVLVHASSANSAPTMADGSTAGTGATKPSSGSVGVGVAVGIDTTTTKAYIGGTTTTTVNSPTITVESVMPDTTGTTDQGNWTQGTTYAHERRRDRPDDRLQVRRARR